MPITLPQIDDRRYSDLREEALARVRVHTPEYTNPSRSDPGGAIIDVFAFIAETLLYRASLIPERNRKKFLKLLGIGLQPGSAARGLVQIGNMLPVPTVVTMEPESELAAGQIPFRTTR